MDPLNGWTISHVLGEGAFGEVRLIVNQCTNEVVAGKLIDTKKYPDASILIQQEVDIHSTLSHENVIKFYGHRPADNESSIEYIFLEYASGGELFDRIEPDIGMPLTQAHKYFVQLINGIDYLHQNFIVHRDLKPENLLLDGNDVIKISDFGMATKFVNLDGKEVTLNGKCGTIQYMAPEVLISFPTSVVGGIKSRDYRGPPIDVWSSGVILTALLTGQLPWDAPMSACPDYLDWKSGKTFKEPWTRLTNLTLSFLTKILSTNPRFRITIDQIKNHSWFKRDFSKRKMLFGSPVKDKDMKPFANKRIKTGLTDANNSDKQVQGNYSQPLPVVNPIHGLVSNLKYNNSTNDVTNEDGVKAIVSNADDICIDNIQYFTQPEKFDNMLLSSQSFPSTSSQDMAMDTNLVGHKDDNGSNKPTSVSSYSQLVKRMTRFMTTASVEETHNYLVNHFDKNGFGFKKTGPGQLTIDTVDRRKNPLVFKVTVIMMAMKYILVDFRLSRGDGIEFKRHFLNIKRNMEGIIMREPVTWLLAAATNSLP